MSGSAEVALLFGGEERVFRLPIGRIRAVQAKCDAGPMELLQRYMTGRWRLDDLREVLLQGLVGGGMDQSAATRLVIDNFDDQPMQQFVLLAQAIVSAAVVGVEDEPLGEPKGEDQPMNPSPEESSALPGSMDPAPSSE